MFDLVPLARARGEMTHGDGQPRPIGEPLQFPLPEADAWAIAAAGVRGNHERSRTRIRAATHLLPPPANRIHREAGGVVVNPDAHPAFIATQIVHAVGDRFPVSGVANDKVVHAHPVGLAFAPPRAAAIFEIADQLLLLRVDRDRRVSLPLRPLDGLGYIAELR